MQCFNCADFGHKTQTIINILLTCFISESEALSVYRISAKTEEINEVKATFNKGKRT